MSLAPAQEIAVSVLPQRATGPSARVISMRCTLILAIKRSILSRPLRARRSSDGEAACVPLPRASKGRRRVPLGRLLFDCYTYILPILRLIAKWVWDHEKAPGGKRRG